MAKKHTIFPHVYTWFAHKSKCQLQDHAVIANLFDSKIFFGLYPPLDTLNSVYVVVQLYSRFNFHFPLFYTHYHTLPYTKTMENKN